MAYQPAPSDYTAGCVACPYYDSDFFNADFRQLWDTANGGRGDLQKMATELHVNLLHLYDWNAPPLRNHLPFMNEALANGIRIAVPISNYFVASDPQAAAHIQAIVREVYSDAQGNPTTVPHPSVVMWTIANEYDLNPITAQQVAQAAAYIVAAEQAIGATQLLPVSVPVSFGTFGGDPGVVKTNEAIAAFNAQAGLPSDFVSSRFIAATNPQNPGSFITDWLPKFKAQVPNTLLWFSEMGTAVQNSCTGYPQPCTPSEQQQATFNADQFKASRPGAEGILLGGAQFEFQDEPWKSGADATFGIYKFAVPASFTTVDTSWTNPDPKGPTPLKGKYRVDALAQKPSWFALQAAFGAGLGGVGVAPGADPSAAASLLGAGLCDPLLTACGPAPAAETTPPPPPATTQSDSGSAVGGAPRMPNLRATASASWQDGRVTVAVRVLISKPKLVPRSPLVRIAIPWLNETRTLRIHLDGKRTQTVTTSFIADASAVGRPVAVKVDPDDVIPETRERDNTARARIR